MSDGLSGDTDRIEGVEFVDQNPIGKSSRSNPATYVKAWDDVRSLFAAQPLARNRGYKPSVFSFNTSGGRCETCEGEGRVSIGMQFMADVTLSRATPAKAGGSPTPSSRLRWTDATSTTCCK